MRRLLLLALICAERVAVWGADCGNFQATSANLANLQDPSCERALQDLGIGHLFSREASMLPACLSPTDGKNGDGGDVTCACPVGYTDTLFQTDEKECMAWEPSRISTCLMCAAANPAHQSTFDCSQAPTAVCAHARQRQVVGSVSGLFASQTRLLKRDCCRARRLRLTCEACPVCRPVRLICTRRCPTCSCAAVWRNQLLQQRPQPGLWCGPISKQRGRKCTGVQGVLGKVSSGRRSAVQVRQVSRPAMPAMHQHAIHQ